jgi:hypothetical protein
MGDGGLSIPGTGDLSGYNFFNQADIPFSKRFFLSPGIQFTNNSQTYSLTNDIRLNYVTSGIDFFTNIQYLVLNKSHHRIARSRSINKIRKFILPKGSKLKSGNFG